MVKQLSIILISIILHLTIYGQERTVGVTKYTEEVSEGLVFFCPATPIAFDRLSW